MCRKLDNPAAIGRRLREYREHSDLEIDSSGRVSQYKLLDSRRQAQDIDVTEPEDILELPCMKNIDEYNMENKPVRWVLFSVARILMSVENDFDVEEIAEFFSRYPWYDKDTTMYQLQYEKNQRMADGNIPMPIGCRNDNKHFATFCIGIENCEYRIYGSLPMKDEVYEQLDAYSDSEY